MKVFYTLGKGTCLSSLLTHFLPRMMVLVLVCVGLQMRAQNISGRVLSASDESPMIGASVLEKGTQNGAVTDLDGAFSLTVAKLPATLEISYIGYAKQTVEVDASSGSIVVRLSEGTALDEVVVTALGIERSKKNLTYSVQEIQGDELTEVRDANFVNTLNGKVAGLVVTTGANGPGGASRVVLRGNTSISGNNNALIVVDGVPIDNSSPNQTGNDFGGYNSNDGMSNINPNDIENISILKGGAAAALYGSRGANGVMLITTKKGKSGQIKTNINSGIDFRSPFILPQFQNEYGQGNGGQSNATSSGSWGGSATTYPDNIENFFRTGVSLNNSVSISGGTQKTKAYMSFTNLQDQGIVPNNSLERNTFNVRIGHDISDRLHADLKATVMRQSIENKVRVGEEGGIVQNLYKTPRSVDLEDYKSFEDENGNPTYWTTSSIYMNPHWTLNRVLNDDTRDRSIILGSLTYDITDRIKLTGRASLDKSNDDAEYQFYNGTLLFAQAGGSYQQQLAFFKEDNFDLFLNGHQDLSEDFRFDFLVGAALNKRSSRFNDLVANGLLVPNKFSLDFASNLSSSTTITEREYQSVFGTVSFAYKNFLVVDGSARNDWSSTLPAPHSFFYPSAGLTFILSDATDLPSFITFAKLRGAWSQVGNDPDPYRLQNTFSVEQGGSGGFIRRDPLKNIADLKAELTNSIEFGADIRMLDSKLGVDLTWYKTNTTNQLLRVPLPAPTGFEEEYINAGDVQNTGIELVLNWRAIDRPDFSYHTAVNFARNVNEVLELNSRLDRVFLTSGGFARTATPIVEEGRPYGELYAEGWLRDGQGRFVVNDQGLPIGSGGGEVKVGNFNPDFLLGWNNKFSFKGVDVSFLIDGRFGGVMVSGTEANLAFDGNADYTTAFRDGGLVLDAVTQSGERNTMAISAEQFWTTVSNGRYSWGEFFTYDATNVRLRELSIGYDIDLPTRLGIERCRLSAVGRNLFFFYRGKAILDIPGIPDRKLNFDPDIQLGAGNFQGVEYGTLPATRSIGLNLSLSF